ncbi:MAG: hypothetical protein V2I33_19585 [Kangiellaceae bacterium]|jgi:hypothetical protein|nr:hypothetical protein [Kangiellaceae bacterium]
MADLTPPQNEAVAGPVNVELVQAYPGADDESNRSGDELANPNAPENEEEKEKPDDGD